MQEYFTEEELKAHALQICMTTKMRYMDALNVAVMAVVNANATGLSPKPIDPEYHEQFKKDYAEYQAKMTAAGMK